MFIEDLDDGYDIKDTIRCQRAVRPKSWVDSGGPSGRLVDSESQSPYNAFGGGHTTESAAGQLTTTFPITGHL